MKNNKKRGLLASAGALVTAVALALGGAATAQAAPPNMPAKSGLVITKLEQPTTAGAAATGESIDVSSYTAIQGVDFAAYPVTVSGTPGTDAWLANMAAVTLAQAQTEVDGPPAVTAVRTGTTDANGVISWTGASTTDGDLDRGLYLIRETSTPTGVIGSGDFLVALPMTNPTALNDWLPTVYVYPKNARVGNPVKTVSNAADLKVGDTVTWTISADLPRKRAADNSVVPTDYFEVSDALTDAQLVLNETSPATGITASAPGVTLTKGTETPVTGDYYIKSTTVAGVTTHQVIFTSDGLAKLATSAGANLTNKLTVTLDTTVKQTAVIGNQAKVFPNQLSKTEDKPLTSNNAEVKYGTYGLNKVSSAATQPASLAGAQFKVYASEAAALAGGNDNLKPDVTGTGYDPVTGVWTTATDGQVNVAGLRYSNFADNAVQAKFIDDAGTCANYNAGGTNCQPNTKFQTYWLVEVKALSGHQLLAAPVPFEVNENSATQAYEIVNQENKNGFVLPLTGGMGTAILTIGGVAILAIVLIVARRRRDTEANAE